VVGVYIFSFKERIEWVVNPSLKGAGGYFQVVIEIYFIHIGIVCLTETV
jgi:hypothetical protein